MTIVRHELRQGRKGFLIWTIAIAAFMMLCVFMFPEMKGQMAAVSKIFSSMGFFTAAFGMDVLDFGSLIGFYAVECGNIIGLGGAFFAAIISVSMLSKEESGRTAEFLYAHPKARLRIWAEKLAAILIEITAMNVIVFICSIASVAMIGEAIPWNEFALLHLAYYFCQIEISLICYAFSAIMKGNGFGAALGLVLVFYFMNLCANISDKAGFMRVITPFGYAEGSKILTKMSLNGGLIALGLVIGIAFAAAGFIYYQRKDIS